MSLMTEMAPPSLQPDNEGRTVESEIMYSKLVIDELVTSILESCLAKRKKFDYGTPQQQMD